MKNIIVLILSLLLSTGFAKDTEEQLPLGCKKLGYYFELKTLTLLPESIGSKQSLYFFFNKLKQPISLYQMRNEKNPASIYLNQTVDTGRWAVLSTTESSLKFICTIPRANHEYGEVVDCEQGLTVCEFTKVRYGLNNRGNYWLVKGNTKGGAIHEVIYYGIIPQ